MLGVGLYLSPLLVNASPYGGVHTAYFLLAEALPIALPAAVWLMTPHGSYLRGGVRLRRPDAIILLIIPIAVVSFLAVNGITSVWDGLWRLLGGNSANITGVETPSTLPALFVALVSLALSPALFEEFLFRGIILPIYERKFRSPWPAIVLSGLIFALMHGSIIGLPAHIILGILFAFVVVVTDSIWAGVLYHFLHNGIAVTYSYIVEYVLDPALLAEQGLAWEQATSPELLGLIGGAALQSLLYSAVLIGLLVFLYRLRKNSRKRAYTPVPTPLAEPLDDRIGRKPSLLPWVPLIAAVPMILLQYTGTIFMLYADFTSLLTR